jgi:predicted DNA-binding transcriptional regulator AlpA
MNQSIRSFGQSSLNALPDEGFIRQKSMHDLSLLPFSASTLWRKINEGKFPKPIQISDGITAWRIRDLKSWAKDPTGYSTEAQQEGR